MGSMKEKNRMGKQSMRVRVAISDQAGIGKYRSLIGDLISLEDHPVLLAEELACRCHVLSDS